MRFSGKLNWLYQSASASAISALWKKPHTCKLIPNWTRKTLWLLSKNVNAIVNFAQIVQKATCLMSITQYNSNNSRSPEFKWAWSEKKKKIWINSLTHEKKDRWSKFRLGPKVRTLRQVGTIRNTKFTADPRSTVFSKSANLLLHLSKKSTTWTLFKAKYVDPKTQKWSSLTRL